MRLRFILNCIQKNGKINFKNYYSFKINFLQENLSSCFIIFLCLLILFFLLILYLFIQNFIKSRIFNVSNIFIKNKWDTQNYTCIIFDRYENFYCICGKMNYIMVMVQNYYLNLFNLLIKCYSFYYNIFFIKCKKIY